MARRSRQAPPIASSRAGSRGCSRARDCRRPSSSTSCWTAWNGRSIVSASATARELLSQFDTKRANELVREALNAAGIVVGGSAPWDITVHDDRFYQRLL